MHGGISPNLKEKSDIDKVSRFIEPVKGLMFDLLWSDPVDDDDCRKTGFKTNTNRDCSWYFGIEPVKKLLISGDYVAILRAHEVQNEGYKMHTWADKCSPLIYTVFSAPNYCGNYGNKGAIFSITDEELKIVKFDEVSEKPYFW
jgi:serine/threonine-protein phosphatase 2B catalytic subunit